MAVVFITGATGFLGVSLAQFLKSQGYTVFGTTTGEPGEGLYHCYISNKEALDSIVREINPDVVVHCAAISSVTFENTLEMYSTNVLGTQNLLSALSGLEKRARLIFVSTAGVYGNQGVDLLHEELPPLPVHHYGMSKFCAERLMYNYRDALDFTIIRPFNIIGEGQNISFLVPKLVNAFAKGDQTIQLGNINVFRDFIDVHDTRAIIAQMIDCKQSHGEIVNLCTGVATSLRAIIEILQKIAGYKIEIVQAPQFTRKSEVWRLLGSCEKLDRFLPDRAPLAPLEASLYRMFHSRREKLEASS